MNKDLVNTMILATSFLALFGTAEILYHFVKLKAEITRKFVHLLTGFLTLLFPLMLNNHWLVLFLCASFALILLLSQKYDLLKSINKIDRESYGSVSYPVAVYGSYLVFDHYHHYIFFYVPILILAVCDPIAALTGKRWPKGKYRIGNETKTLMGSFMFFLASFVLSTILFLNMTKEPLLTSGLFSVIIALTTTITEALSRKGLDNLSIPAVSLVILAVSVNFTILDL
jgi:phytol kinase